MWPTAKMELNFYSHTNILCGSGGYLVFMVIRSKFNSRQLALFPLIHLIRCLRLDCCHFLWFSCIPQYDSTYVAIHSGNHVTVSPIFVHVPHSKRCTTELQLTAWLMCSIYSCTYTVFMSTALNEWYGTLNCNSFLPWLYLQLRQDVEDVSHSVKSYQEILL